MKVLLGPVFGGAGQAVYCVCGACYRLALVQHMTCGPDPRLDIMGARRVRWRFQPAVERPIMEDNPGSQRKFSRRLFIMGLPIGVLGALAVGFVSNRVLGSLIGRRGYAEPPEDSIFTPSKDRYPRA